MPATDTAALYMLRIEVDGHFHGSPDVPKPWVARIDGISPRFGLQREFIKPMNDWRDASKAWSGNIYGVVATFPLRAVLCTRVRGHAENQANVTWLASSFGSPAASL